MSNTGERKPRNRWKTCLRWVMWPRSVEEENYRRIWLHASGGNIPMPSTKSSSIVVDAGLSLMMVPDPAEI